MLFIVFATFSMTFQDKYEYVYDKDAPKYFLHSVGDLPCIGHIDAFGSFVPNIKDLDKVIQARKRNEFVGGVSAPTPLIMQVKPNEPVYAYRSGILVPMIIDNKRGLIHEVGGKIIDFKDYHYSPTARRIYNLPGRFVLKKEEPTRKP